jgi:hypothetical protein
MVTRVNPRGGPWTRNPMPVWVQKGPPALRRLFEADFDFRMRLLRAERPERAAFIAEAEARATVELPAAPRSSTASGGASMQDDS